jgi:V-type H+-transporting ATPase subunit C
MLSRYIPLMNAWHASSKLASDDEFTLFNVTLFKKFKDEFIHKCRENK